MIGLDTNILVRYFARDDPVQFDFAAEILEHQLTETNPGFVSVVVMAETVWVLERSYDMSPDEIAQVIEVMLETDILVIQNEKEVFAALASLKQGQGDFADALIAALGAEVGCTHTLTFDRRALRLPGYKLA